MEELEKLFPCELYRRDGNDCIDFFDTAYQNAIQFSAQNKRDIEELKAFTDNVSGAASEARGAADAAQKAADIAQKSSDAAQAAADSAQMAADQAWELLTNVEADVTQLRVDVNKISDTTGSKGLTAQQYDNLIINNAGFIRVTN